MDGSSARRQTTNSLFSMMWISWFSQQNKQGDFVSIVTLFCQWKAEIYPQAYNCRSQGELNFHFIFQYQEMGDGIFHRHFVKCKMFVLLSQVQWKLFLTNL